MVSLIDDVIQTRDGDDFGAAQDNALSISLDPGAHAVGDVKLSRGVGVAEVVQVGIAQFEKVGVATLERAENDILTAAIDDNLDADKLFQHGR